MRTQGTLLILVSLFVIILTIAVANAETIKWYKYEAGMEEAGSTGKTVIVEFYAKWCPPCNAMENETYPDQRVISEMKDFIAIKVDADVRPDIETKYNIGDYIPTIIFLDPKGNEINRHIGYLGPEDMVKTIKESRGKLPKEAPGFEATNLLFIFLYATRMFFLQKKHKKTFI